MNNRIIIGSFGVTGIIYEIETLRLLGSLNDETHLILDRGGLKNHPDRDRVLN